MRSGLKLVGLTGGIGTGKSTVARLIAEAGVPVIDADEVARAVVAPGQPAHAEIAAAWPAVIAPDGAIDRKKLGAIVFADPAARKRLEAITHGHIRALSDRRAEALAAAGHALAFYEATLLVETGRHRELDGLVVVTAPEATQIARTVARDGLTESEARARIAAQLPQAEKVRAATDVIDNGGTVDEARAQVQRLLDRLRGGVRRPG